MPVQHKNVPPRRWKLVVTGDGVERGADDSVAALAYYLFYDVATGFAVLGEEVTRVNS